MAKPTVGGTITLMLLLGAALMTGLVAWPVIGRLADRTAVRPDGGESTPPVVTFVVSPHPDDEFQAWSLVEHRPGTYKVFILATHGEETGFCTPSGFEKGWQPALEPAPLRMPTGRWTTSCEAARLSSWRGYFTDMGAEDRGIPGNLRSLSTRGPFPAPATVCHRDGSGKCRRDRTARVWIDRDGRGALVAFNLGDGDLTPREVAWAIRTVKRHRSELGINVSSPIGDLVASSYYNDSFDDCFRYPHPDHAAVQTALRRADFHVGRQIAPTCTSDPGASFSALVSKSSAKAAFEIGPNSKRLGAHTRNYGWLANPYYRLDREGQDTAYHTHQTFWVH